MVGTGVPSIRLKALRLPPSSRIATFSATPSSLAFATAAFTMFCASSEEMPCFLTTLAIGLPPSVRTVTAVDVEDVTRDERGLVRRDEHDAVGDLLGQAESTQRDLRREGRLVLRRAGEAGQHAGVRGAWCDGIHANSRLGDFERHRLGDAFDGVLGADVDRGESCTLVPVGRGDIDDAAAPLGLHGAYFMLHAQDHAQNVGLERRGKAFRGLVRDRADRTFGGGVVHGDIEMPKPRDGPVDHIADVVLLANVGVDELGFRAESAQLLNERLSGLITPTGNDDLRALLGKGDGGSAAYACEASRDQNDWPIHFRFSSITRACLLRGPYFRI